MAPPIPVRLIATDLDGTLLDAKGQVSPRTQAALLAAEEAGLVVVFVTGRPLRWAEEVFAHVAGHGYAIVSNGTVLWNVAESTPAAVHPFETEGLLTLADRLRAAVPGSVFATESLAGIALEDGFMERYPVPDGAVRGEFAAIITRPVVKLLARHEELAPQEFWDRAEAAIGDLAEITWSSATTLLEMSPPGVTKASTLAAFCAERGISAAEVVAFGDMPNDLAMLAWAGRGIAVANAHPTVLAAADDQAPHHAEDGVAQVIEQILSTIS